MAFTKSDKGMLEGYIKQARPFQDMFSVKGKVALVTGGSSGLGFDITLRLLQGGAKVVIASYSELEAESSIPLLEEQGFKGSVAFKLTDVSKEAQVKELVDFTVETFGSLDIFVNCAAVWNYAHIYDIDERDVRKVFDVNVMGAFFGVKHVSKYMKENGIRGKMVLISSNCPVMPYPVFGGYPHYASSKAAVMGLTTEAAKELKRFGIMVNSIAPGAMVTPGSAGNLASSYLTEEQQDEFYEELMVWQTDGQLPVDQIGIMAYTFCTPASDGITGEVVMVDGGQTHNIVSYQAAIDQYPPEEE
ncbi:MAG: SDR family oxidoreductase [Firmicutes bacterium]|nr:SDR family oxidoreductase [Bacillota bacterium]